MARKQNLRTLEDGSTEVVCADDWLSPTNIKQLMEVLDNKKESFSRNLSHFIPAAYFVQETKVPRKGKIKNSEWWNDLNESKNISQY